MIPFFGLQKMQKSFSSGSPAVDPRDARSLASVQSTSRGLTAGFTLIEFVVIISIFAIMAGVGLFNFRGFQTDVSLTNLAHDIALTIKRAQSEGTSGLTGTNNDPIERGVAFKYVGNEFSNEFVIFDDINQDGVFDIGEEVDTIRIQSEDYIHSIITGIPLSTWSTGANDTFDIMFQRPFPDVKSFGTVLNTSSDPYAVIIISNQDQSKKQMIMVSRVGEISVRPCDEQNISLCNIP